MLTQAGPDQEQMHGVLLEQHGQLTQGGALKRVRMKAWERFLELGYPHKKMEVYNYVPLRKFYEETFVLAGTGTASREEVQALVYPECEGSYLVLVNGRYSPELSCTDQFHSSVEVFSISEAMGRYASFLNNRWQKSVKAETDPLASLALAMNDDGLFLYVPPKTQCETPIQIIHLVQGTSESLNMINPYVHIAVGAQSSLKVCVETIGNGQHICVNHLTQCSLDEAARVEYLNLSVDHHEAAWIYDALRVRCKRDSVFRSLSMTNGSATVRQDYSCVLEGENSEVHLEGLGYLKDKRQAHTNVFMEHVAPHTRSTQLFKNCLSDTSRASFEGKIYVHSEAQKTDAFQLSSNLLLDRAIANCKPNLEIFADDVKCSHGVTVGRLDAEALFYLKSRGLPENAAKSLLVSGFLQELVDRISLESLKKRMMREIQSFLHLSE